MNLPGLIVQLDGSRREAVDGYASACADSPLFRMLPVEWSLSGGGGSLGERGCLCCVQCRHMNENFLG